MYTYFFAVVSCCWFFFFMYLWLGCVCVCGCWCFCSLLAFRQNKKKNSISSCSWLSWCYNHRSLIWFSPIFTQTIESVKGKTSFEQITEKKTRKQQAKINKITSWMSHTEHRHHHHHLSIQPKQWIEFSSLFFGVVWSKFSFFAHFHIQCLFSFVHLFSAFHCHKMLSIAKLFPILTENKWLISPRRRTFKAHTYWWLLLVHNFYIGIWLFDRKCVFFSHFFFVTQNNMRFINGKNTISNCDHNTQHTYFDLLWSIKM